MRLFVAIDPSADVRQRTAEGVRRVAKLAPDAKWVGEHAMHVTLAFLGEVAEEDAPRFAEAMTRAAAGHAPLALGVAGGGTFGNPRRPRVLWVDLVGDLDALRALQRDVVAALVPLGFVPEERPFSPHLTLARARDPRGDAALAACAEALRDADFGRCDVGEVVLYRSRLSPSGSQYTPVAVAPLAAARRSSA